MANDAAVGASAAAAVAVGSGEAAADSAVAEVLEAALPEKMRTGSAVGSSL